MMNLSAGAKGLPNIDPNKQAAQIPPSESEQDFSGLSRLLRIVGGFSVVASMSVFLLQGWDSGNDIGRYYLLLSQSVLLALGGFLLSYLIKENKGARVFLGLALLSVTANITTLGALIYSFVQWDTALTDYPQMARWSASDTLSIGLALGSAIAVLVPVSIFGFRVMARPAAKVLAIAFLFSNGLLLIPVRDTSFVAVLAGLMIFFTLAFNAQQSRGDAALRTLEGKFARLLLFVPSVILLVRSTWLYQVNEVLYTVLGLIVFMILRTLCQGLRSDSSMRRTLDLASLPVAVVVAIPAASLLDNLLVINITLPAFALIANALFFELAGRTAVAADRISILCAASLLLSVSFLANLLFQYGPLAGILSCLAGLAVIIMGYWIAQRSIVLLGAMTSLLGFLSAIYALLGNIDLLSWSSLAVLGSLAIVIGSIVERHGVAIQLRIHDGLKRVQTISLHDRD
ncbi:MAG: hypothetical protein JKX92_14905 [Porticoccaceae bacterium]|nr:hypothetical protein [Porticoccaceae bacterium]